MAGILTAEQLNAIAKNSGYTGGTFGSTGLASTPQVSNESLGLNSTNLAPSPSITLPNQPQPSTFDTSGGNAMIAYNSQTLAGQPNTTPDWLKQFLDSSTPPPSTSGIYSNLESQAGIADKQSAFNADAQAQQEAQAKFDALNAQLQGFAAESQAIPIRDQQNAEGRGVTVAGLAPITSAQLRDNALRALPVQSAALVAQAGLAAAQGKTALSQSILQQAKDHVDRLFSLHIQDATNQYNYQKELRDRVFEVASKAEQNRLEALQRQSDQNFQLFKGSVDYARELANIAVQNGQGDLAGKITGLDPNSSTFTSDLAKLQSQLQMSPSARLDIALKQAQLAKVQKETSLLGEPTKEEKKAEAEALRNAKTAIPLLQDKINFIDTLSEHPGLKATVGTFILGRFPTISTLTGDAQAFAGGVHQLINKETIDTLVNLKARGGTLGALSDQERLLLQSAATKLGDWEIKDKNNVGTGRWNIDEKSFKDELANIKRIATIALTNARGDIFSPDETQTLDSIFGTFNNVSPASYY